MSRAASRGAVVLVMAQGLYFVLGYLVVVALARELGPAAYGAYSVIMSVLVWVEQSAKRAVPAAAAKLIAENPAQEGDIGQTATVLNFAGHCLLYAVFWVLAPALSAAFSLENGTFLFRLAALDLPVYGIYTALQGVHQGRHRFYRLGFSDLVYAVAKLAGVLGMIAIGLSVELALIINIAASVIGIAFLWTRTVGARLVRWRAHAGPILEIARHVALYSVASLLLSSFDIWILDARTPLASEATVGVYVAALNIARVPGFALATVSMVLLPSVARAYAANDHDLIRHYLNQTVRFFLMLYLAGSLMLCTAPEELMQLVYSDRYSGGGTQLRVLVLAHGLWALQAILAAVLVATGQARALGRIVAVLLLIALPLMTVLVDNFGGLGSAIGSATIACSSVAACTVLLLRQFGAVVQIKNMVKILAAGAIMLAASNFCSAAMHGGPLISITAGLLAYGVALILLSELKVGEIVGILSRSGAK